ncbi:NAD-dependent epimerase/dehydratase family protein [Enterovirga aerilata]|uniref:NAD-dependent epimerase/dehydratase family protein n=1 Tax=Enterovirga aerilata TaxID=2730920 RepID=A0A849I8Z1_9HYPH|nr:NAD-dependent epimerase/dehydratase family protein [Enterovirga sp. DB1703]NNM72879.1 NAD-dependent epimerase/dehydratase family protein [Enterovirga sp. DB1703]
MEAGRIVVTGARGRIGRALAGHWRGRDLVLLDREEGDLARYDPAWAGRLAGAGTLVHLAADPDPASAFASAAKANTEALLNVLQACDEHGIGRLVYASSVWADFAAWRLAPRMTWYAASKIAGEALVVAWADQNARPAVCLRFGYFDPAAVDVPPEAETHRLNEAALGFHLDAALAWSEPRCTIRYAMGKL